MKLHQDTVILELAIAEKLLARSNDKCRMYEDTIRALNRKITELKSKVANSSKKKRR